MSDDLKARIAAVIGLDPTGWPLLDDCLAAVTCRHYGMRASGPRRSDDPTAQTNLCDRYRPASEFLERTAVALGSEL